MDKQAQGPLVRVLDEIAITSRWSVRGPHRVGKFVQERTGEGPSGASWSAYFTGKTRPKPETILLFARAFEPSAEQLQRLTHAFTYDEEPPEDASIHPSYEELAARLKAAGGGPVEIPEFELEPKPEADESKEEYVASESGGATPADWVGERVRAYMETGEEVQGTLQSVDAHGVVIDRRARPPSPSGPCFYSWRIVQWLDPLDRQVTRR